MRTQLISMTVLGLILLSSGDLLGAKIIELGGFKVEAISADGSTVVGGTDLIAEAIRWNAESGIVALGELPGGLNRSEAQGVSGDGTVVVGRSAVAGGYHVFHWTADSGMVKLEELDGNVDPALRSSVHISDDGSSIVGSWQVDGGNTSQRFPFYWSEDTGMLQFSDAFGAESDPFYIDNFRAGAFIDISPDGESAVGRANIATGRWQTFRWNIDTGYERLLDSSFVPSAVSRDGSTIVGATAPSQGSSWPWFPALWTQEAGLTLLGTLPGHDFSIAIATAISADGSVIVGSSNSAETGFAQEEAFIWDEINGIRSLKNVLLRDFGLDITGWELWGATDISADGNVIVGNGVSPIGDEVAWMVVIPEPSTEALTICALLGVIAFTTHLHK